MRAAGLAVFWAALLAVATVAWAGETYVVRMGGPEGEFRFDPEIIHIQPGDSVLFRATNHLHASRAINSMCGAETVWRGKVGEDVVVRFDEEGIYGFKCGAHYSLGMVGLVVVGDHPRMTDEALAARHPPRAAAAFERLLTSIEAQPK